MAKRDTDDNVLGVSEADSRQLLLDKEERIKKRAAKYERDFEQGSLTNYDKEQILRMAKFDEIADSASDQLTTNPNLSANHQKNLNDTAARASAESRQIADTLGISRKKRMNDESSEYEAYLPRLFKETQTFMYERALVITCPECLKQKPRVRLHLGSIIYPFSFETEWSWKSKCPRCGESFQINQDNYIQFTFAEVMKDMDDEEVNPLADDDDEGEEE